MSLRIYSIPLIVFLLLAGSAPGLRALAGQIPSQPTSAQASTDAPTFNDVSPTYWAFDWIELLYDARITSGCSTSPMLFCPENNVTRAQMAVFLERGLHYPNSFTPPAGTGTLFTDVPSSYWAGNWIEKLYTDGITQGCRVSPLSYCPEDTVTRAQMAIFLLRARHGAAYTPPAPVGIFADVLPSYWAAGWIEQLYAEEITTGCSASPLSYCPEQPVSRAQMAVFLARTFNLRPDTGARYTIEQTLSDGAQRNTIAFDALAFLTGNLGADSFFPPGKVADFWGFQYLRDNDRSEMGHNTDFLTRASLNMLSALTPSQQGELIALAESQVDDINQYAYDRFVLMDAFRRLLEGDLPAGATGLDPDAVAAYSAELYRLDGQISYERAQVMGGLLAEMDAAQRAYLDGMVGQGMLDWPVVSEPADLQGLGRDVKVAVMTYAGDMFSWYAGSVEADVYFCPERQGTYFGSFYMKDAPAVGNPGYSIPTDLTGEMGAAFLEVLTPEQAALITGLVDAQKPVLYEIVDRREEVSVLLRQFMAGGTADQASVLNLMERYGELDGDIITRYATAFAKVAQTLTAGQRVQLVTLRTDLLDELSYPTGAYLYSQTIPMPVIPNTDFLFNSP